jgi:CHAD domain-containing protein
LRARDEEKTMSSSLPLILSQTEPAGPAVRRILLDLTGVIDAHWPGIIDDVDPEHLHDLRVATRRTRTALGQLKGSLPKPTVTPFRAEFNWLATITGPCRDHDVWIEDLRQDLPLVTTASDPAIVSIVRAAGEKRRRVWLTLEDHLRSARFSRLCPAWRAALDASAACRSEDGSRPVKDVATERILRAHKRLVRHGDEIVQGAPDEILHRTRIDAKKLRYLLEFFSACYPRDAVRGVIRRLKDLQDDLGRFNDCAVQRLLLADLRSQFEPARPAHDSTTQTIHALGKHIKARQESCRAPFREHYLLFISESTPQALADLVNQPVTAP